MINGKLGKRPPSNKPALRFADHLITVPEHPVEDVAPSLNYPMDLNDRFGVCVVAGADHTLQVVNNLLGQPYTNWDDNTIIRLYKTQNPDFDPTTDANDNGMDIQTFLEYLVHNKIIVAFAKVDHTNEEEVKAATYLGLSLMIGQILTQSQEQQQVWDYVPNDPEIGGHCTAWVGYTGDQEACVTWGELVNVTQPFIQNQVDECWFVLTQAHINHPDFRANYSLDSFAAAYTDLTGKPFPVQITPVPPAPTPTPHHHDPDAALWKVLERDYQRVVEWAKSKGLL